MTKDQRKESRLIRYAEKFFKTDITYIASGGFWLSSGQIYAAIIAFLLSIAFANFIPKESYGVYKYILSAGGIISAFSLTGLATAVLQSTARGLDGVLTHAFKTSLKWSVLPILASSSASIYYFLQQNNTLGLAFIIIAICNPLIQASFLYKSFLNGKKRFKKTTQLLIIQNTITALLILGAILYTTHPLLIALAYFGGNALLGILLYIYTYKTQRVSLETDPEAIAYGKHISVINILNTVATHIDKILLFQLIGGTALAVYAFAIAIPEQIRALFKTIPQLAIPKFAAQDIHSIKKNIFPKIWKIFLITTPIVIVYILTAPYIFNIFFPAYSESILYSQIFSIILLVEGGIAGAIFKAQKALREQYTLNIVTNIIKIVLLLVLVVPYGIWGVVGARILGRYTSFGVSLILLTRLKSE